MTTPTTRPMLAVAFAVAMIAGFSNPSFAALSSADRSAPATSVPAPETTFVATTSSPATASDVAATAAPAVKAAAPVTAAAPVVEKRKTIAHKVEPRRIATAPAFAAPASFAGGTAGTSRGYPCH